MGYLEDRKRENRDIKKKVGSVTPSDDTTVSVEMQTFQKTIVECLRLFPILIV